MSGVSPTRSIDALLRSEPRIEVPSARPPSRQAPVAIEPELSGIRHVWQHHALMRDKVARHGAGVTSALELAVMASVGRS